MNRFLLLVAVAAACIVWCGLDAVAQTDEFQLPPVKLKPDRPTTVKPIPPTPDEREAPKAPEPPKVEPPTVTPPKVEAPRPEPPAAAPPKIIAKPVETPKVTPPAEVAPPSPAEIVGPKAGPVEMSPPAKAPVAEPKPVQTPADLPLPPPPVLTPSAPPPPETPPVLALPVEAPKAAGFAPAAPVVPAAAAVEEGPKAADVQAETAEAQVGPVPTAPMDLTGLGEVGLVEEVARARKAYSRALEALTAFYAARGTQHKIEWVNAETQAWANVPKVQYLIVAELAGPSLRPTQTIDAADQLFKEGMDYKDYPAFPPAKKEHLKQALEKFATIIEKYPQSDKIDDAAFRMGEIYQGWYFEDWARAVQSYERCWQWSTQTEYPAVFNAAKIYDEKLKNRMKAAELYNRVVAESKNNDHVRQAQDRLKALAGK
jgi:TolA-binding protein